MRLHELRNRVVKVGFVHGIFQRCRTAGHIVDSGAQKLHAKNIQGLTTDVFRPHEDIAFHAEKRSNRCRSNSMLSGAGLMQQEAGVSIDVVRIIQSMVLLFVAADAIVRYIFRLRGEGTSHLETAPTGWASS